MTDSPPAPVRKRVRLAPAVRKRLILDAALAEFAANGFGATSTEKIARRAGLSQAGLYAHFDSKDAILFAVFQELLEPHDGAAVSGAAIDVWIDRSYAKLADPVFQSIFRILSAEGKRVPHLVGQWRRNVEAGPSDEIVAVREAHRQLLMEQLLEAGATPPPAKRPAALRPRPPSERTHGG